MCKGSSLLVLSFFYLGSSETSDSSGFIFL